MIIKHYEERVKAPFERVTFFLTISTRLVKFGPFGFYNNKLTSFVEPWMGEYDEDLYEFKFFRTIQNTDRTSDFYVKGKLIPSLADTTVRYGIGIYYGQILGVLGLIITCYAFNFLLTSHDYISGEWYWIPVAILCCAFYFLSLRKDFIKTSKAFHQLINSHEHELKSRVHYRDDDYEEVEV